MITVKFCWVLRVRVILNWGLGLGMGLNIVDINVFYSTLTNVFFIFVTFLRFLKTFWTFFYIYDLYCVKSINPYMMTTPQYCKIPQHFSTPLTISLATNVVHTNSVMMQSCSMSQRCTINNILLLRYSTFLLTFYLLNTDVAGNIQLTINSFPWQLKLKDKFPWQSMTDINSPDILTQPHTVQKLN